MNCHQTYFNAITFNRVTTFNIVLKPFLHYIFSSISKCCIYVIVKKKSNNFNLTYPSMFILKPCFHIGHWPIHIHFNSTLTRRILSNIQVSTIPVPGSHIQTWKFGLQKFVQSLQKYEENVSEPYKVPPKTRITLSADPTSHPKNWTPSLIEISTRLTLNISSNPLF